MGHVQVTTHLDCPSDAAFEFGANPERVAEWVTMTAEVAESSGLLDRVGASYTAIMKIAGRRLEARWCVTEVERPRLMKLSGKTPGGGTATFDIEYAPGTGGTEVTADLGFELPGGLFGEIADRILVERAVEREFEHAIDRFKSIVERESRVHA